MAIANYTTTINQNKTIGEIQEMLASHGVENISVSYIAKQPIGIEFVVDVGKGQLIPFRLPCKWEGVLQCLRDENVQQKYRNEQHARRVAWRITRDWIRAQLAIIEAGQAKLIEVFLPYAVNQDGRTIFETFADNGFLALAPASEEP
jgi:hypothetical protein